METLLRLDPKTAERLDLLDGKVIRVCVTSPDIDVVFSVVDRAVNVFSDFDGDVDITLTGTLAALRTLQTGNDALYRGDVKIEGDMQLAKSLKTVISGVDLDWQEWLSPVMGDTVAHQLGVAVEHFSSWFDRTSSAMQDNTREYLQEESELLAPSSEVDYFCSEVDELRASVDRLEARLDLTEKNRK
ncbi:MAG: SCP2 sterol-binding domain-containing protein [Granulosicoccus sp.]